MRPTVCSRKNLRKISERYWSVRAGLDMGRISTKEALINSKGMSAHI